MLAPLKNSKLARRNAHFFGLLVFSSLFLSQVGTHVGNNGIAGDSIHYMTLAYNLVHHKSFSLSCRRADSPCDENDIRLTSYREPGYPAFLAAGILASPTLRAMPRSTFFPAQGKIDDKVVKLQYLSAVLVVLTALFSMGAVRLLSGHWVPAYLTLFLVGFSGTLLENIGHFMSENWVTFLFSGVSFFSALTIIKRSYSAAIFTGLFLGLLALSKAVYLYYWPVAIFGLLALIIFSSPHRRRFIRLGLVFSLVFGLTLAPWLWRNYRWEGSPVIAGRAGGTLTVRALYNQMNREQYLASFLAWTPSKDAQRLLKSKYGQEMANLFNRRHPDGIYQRASHDRTRALKKYGAKRGDSILLKEILLSYLQNPLRHLAISVAIGVRGMFAERGLEIPGVGSLSRAAINPMLFACFFLLSLIALFKQKPAVLAFVFPALFSYAFFTLLTHGLPRYSVPIIPTLWASLSIIGFMAYARGASLIRAKQITFSKKPSP